MSPKKPIGFDLSQIQQQVDRLDTKQDYPLLTEHVTSLNGMHLALQGLVLSILETLTPDQQREVQEIMKIRLDRVAAINMKTPGSKHLQQRTLYFGKTLQKAIEDLSPED